MSSPAPQCLAEPGFLRALRTALNQGADTIQALRISEEDTLVDVAHSTRPLSTTDANAAQVGFSPDGGLLAATEKERPPKRIRRPSTPTSCGPTGGWWARTPSPPREPPRSGFQLGPDGRLYVSEAPGSAASSYDVDDTGNISPVSASIPNNHTAACWLVVTSDGRFAYTANAGSANVSQYAIDADGALSLVGDGANGATDPGPIDLDVSDGDGLLYVLNSRSGSISAFSVDRDDGSLTAIAGVSGLATGWVGLVAV